MLSPFRPRAENEILLAGTHTEREHDLVRLIDANAPQQASLVGQDENFGADAVRKEIILSSSLGGRAEMSVESLKSSQDNVGSPLGSLDGES